MRNFQDKKTAIFIMPRSSSAWIGAEALWITTAGWAAAAKRRFGDSVVVSIDRIASPEEVNSYPLMPGNSRKRKDRKSYARFLPTTIRVFISDVLTWFNHRNWEILDEIKYEGKEVAFVWEKHDLFGGSGKKLADKLKVPYISYVHAPVIWEASKWGVKRYVWGRYLEKKESESLRRADLVAVVSEEVKQKLMNMGVSESKILISPMAVDPSLFVVEETDRGRIRDKYQLKNKFVVGWTGSFRNFHGLEHVIQAFFQVSQEFPHVVLLLIGEGAEKEAIQRLVAELKITEKVIFVGRKPFLEIPEHLALFDIAVVSASNAEGFHYSPLKLREYLVSGVAVLAPDAGEISALFENGYHLKLFQAGNVGSLRKGLEYFIENKEDRQRIAAQGKSMAIATSTWDNELEKTIEWFKRDEQ